MNKQFFLVLGVLAFVGSVQADPTDIFRRPEDREDYRKETRQSGLLHQTYTDREGKEHRRFAPVESILGIRRGGDGYTKYERNDEYDVE